MPQIYDNPTVTQLQRIAADSYAGMARFLVKNGRIEKACDAFYGLHNEMLPHEYQTESPDDYNPAYPHERGMVKLDRDKYHVSIYGRQSRREKWKIMNDHPVLDRFKQMGFTVSDKINESLFYNIPKKNGLRDIVESLSDEKFLKKIHRNTDIETLKKIAEKSDYSQARYIITKDDKIHGADAADRLHDDIEPTHNQHILGFVNCNGRKGFSSWEAVFDKTNDDYECYDLKPSNFGVNTIKGFREKGVKSEHGTNGEIWERQFKEGYLEYHEELNPKLFDKEVLREEVRTKLLKIAREWIKFAKITEKSITDIIFTGSNCNYNYTPLSDIDVHIVYNPEKIIGKDYLEFLSDYFATKKVLWADIHNIGIYGYAVELFAQPENDKLVASGVYSLLHNKWLSHPKRGDYHFDNDPVLNKKIEDTQKMLDNLMAGGVSDRVLKREKAKLRLMRQNALSTNDEFSFDNLVFKGLRNSGVLQRMNSYLKDKEDRSLSLT